MLETIPVTITGPAIPRHMLVKIHVRPEIKSVTPMKRIAYTQQILVPQIGAPQMAFVPVSLHPPRQRVVTAAPVMAKEIASVQTVNGMIPPTTIVLKSKPV